MVSKWDKEADIVVAGYGCAGAVAAISAHDEGAGVLILEKEEHPGGLSIMPHHGGVKFVAQDLPGALRYFTALFGGRIESDLVRTFVEGLAENMAFIQKMARVDGAVTGLSPHRGGTYPLEGGKNLTSFYVTEVPGFSGFPWTDEFRGAQNLFKVLLDNVEARRIPVRLSSPVRRLITDGEGRVTGVMVRSDGQEITIKARRAVVLATGGWEQNEWMRLQFFQGKPVYSAAPLAQTGDGLIMAQKAGAALWHMWHVHGTYGFKFPEVSLAMSHSISGPRDANRVMPWIIVDKFGKRYMNEDPPVAWDTPFRNMQLFNPDLPGYPYIPSCMVFDEAGRKMGPVGLSDSYNNYQWSRDNSAEIKKGWILAGDTIPDLARKLKALPGNESRMEPEKLENTVRQWNQHVSAGKDPLGRLASTMMAIKTPPFYGVPVWPVIHYTQGGIVHDARQRVLDAYHQPIPGLYAVGQVSSLFGHLYQPGGNLGECLTGGRLAGRHAAREKPWT